VQCHAARPDQGVQKLEQELGGELIYRERQLTQLTDLGKQVLPMLERTLASAETVRRRAREFRRKEVAPLKIGLALSISASLVLNPRRWLRDTDVASHALKVGDTAPDFLLPEWPGLLVWTCGHAFWSL
jgi:hypothetical protein